METGTQAREILVDMVSAQGPEVMRMKPNVTVVASRKRGGMTAADDDFFSKSAEYDLVVSLGGNCSVASQLRHRGKRPFSMPFDWALMKDPRPIRYLVDGFGNGFADFMKFENIEEFEPPVDEYGKPTLHIRDKVSGFMFIHQFHGIEFDRKVYDEGIRIINRRMDRFYGAMAKAGRVLFVLQTFFEYDFGLAAALRKAVSAAFPSVEIELRAMQFGAGGNVTEIADDGLLRIYTYERRHNIVYDNQLTAPEWCWMDQLRVLSLPLPEELRKRSLLTKWKFKLWRCLGKSLESDGAGCACMRFRRFGSYGFGDAGVS